VRIPTWIGCLTFTFSVISASSAGAQSSASSDGPTVQPNPQAVKVPPPPLFPKHRRGIYRNAAGLEVIDATRNRPRSIPTIPPFPTAGSTRSTSTHADISEPTSRIDLLTVDANYGILPAIGGHALPMQLKLECPLAVAREAGEPYNVGVGAATFGVKSKFYHDEHRGISLAIYPQVEFAASGGRGVEKGLSEKGRFVFNIALEKPTNDPGRQVATELGAAIGRAFTRKVAG
jgi:hypothetical protein